MCGDEIAADIGGWRWHPRIKAPDAYLNGRWTFQPGAGNYPHAAVYYARTIACFQGLNTYAVCASYAAAVIPFDGDKLTDSNPRLMNEYGDELHYPDLRGARQAIEQRDLVP